MATNVCLHGIFFAPAISWCRDRLTLLIVCVCCNGAECSSTFLVLPSAALLDLPPTVVLIASFSRSSCQNRIEEAHTSDTLLKTVGMTRSMDMSAEREKSEQARAAAQKAKDLRMDNEETPGSRYV